MSGGKKLWRKLKQEKENLPVEITEEALTLASGGISDAKANPENKYIKDETMIIIPITRD